jgi:diguanylate cyclase (GGDEF)-like protein
MTVLLHNWLMDMRTKKSPITSVTNRETRYLAEPAMLTTIILSGGLIIYGIIAVHSGSLDLLPLLAGIAGVIYTGTLYRVIVKTPEYLQEWKWPTTLINALCIATGLIFIPDQFHIIPQIISILIASSLVVLWGRLTSCIFLTLVVGLHIFVAYALAINFSPYWLNDFTLLLLGLIIVETLHRSNKTTQDRIQRLESLNEFARKIVYSLETDEVLSLVGAAIQNAITADTYFLGMSDDGKTIRFDLIFDDGEYFPPYTTPIEGTLSGWVIRNQRSLFIPDMRENVDPEGVKTIMIGKDKNNQSWMGVPMRAEHISGVISVGSYTPNSFDRTDFDLLENLAQQATLALDNAFHHAQIKAQSRTDSLTGAYNHNYIVEIMRREAEKTRPGSLPFSLIMLDVDHFKRYNDHYGHMVGDQVLILLTKTIRDHISISDSVGRWGGEEFAVVLPNQNGPQAFAVAERIQQTMNTLIIQERTGKTVPAPTISQGIAVFPIETNEVDRLIDLADQRLYLAKERGRNQVEPGEEHWSI